MLVHLGKSSAESDVIGAITDFSIRGDNGFMYDVDTLRTGAGLRKRKPLSSEAMRSSPRETHGG